MARSARGTEEGDPLEPALREAEAELHRRLQEACEAEASGVSTDSAAEIRRLEERWSERRSPPSRPSR